MVAGSIQHNSIAVLLAYIMRPDAVAVFDQGRLFNLASIESAELELRDVAALSKRIKRPMQHLFLSWGSGELAAFAHDTTLLVDKMHDAAGRLIDRLGLGDRQAVVVSHWDSKEGQLPGERNYEIHLAVNRVSFDGKVAASSFDYVKVEQAVAKIAKEMGFLQVPGRHNQVVADPENPFIATPRSGPAPLQGAARQLQERTGILSLAEEIHADPDRYVQLKTARKLGWPALIAAFRDQNIGLALGNRRRGPKLERGLVMFDLSEPLRRQKASSLDEPFLKWGCGALEKELGPLPQIIVNTPDSAAKTHRLTDQQAEHQASNVRETAEPLVVRKPAVTRPDNEWWTLFLEKRSAAGGANNAACAAMRTKNSTAFDEYRTTKFKLNKAFRGQLKWLDMRPPAQFPLAIVIVFLCKYIYLRRLSHAEKILMQAQEQAAAHFVRTRTAVPTWSQFKRAKVNEQRAIEFQKAEERLATEERRRADRDRRMKQVEMSVKSGSQRANVLVQTAASACATANAAKISDVISEARSRKQMAEKMAQSVPIPEMEQSNDISGPVRTGNSTLDADDRQRNGSTIDARADPRKPAGGLGGKGKANRTSAPAIAGGRDVATSNPAALRTATGFVVASAAPRLPPDRAVRDLQPPFSNQVSAAQATRGTERTGRGDHDAGVPGTAAETPDRIRKALPPLLPGQGGASLGASIRNLFRFMTAGKPDEKVTAIEAQPIPVPSEPRALPKFESVPDPFEVFPEVEDVTPVCEAVFNAVPAHLHTIALLYMNNTNAGYANLPPDEFEIYKSIERNLSKHASALFRLSFDREDMDRAREVFGHAAELPINPDFLPPPKKIPQPMGQPAKQLLVKAKPQIDRGGRD